MAKKGNYVYEYPHPAVTADCVIFGYDGKDLQVLLVKRGKEKEASSTAHEGMWALPGGFMDIEKDKTIAHTAARELREETGLKLPVKELKEVGTFSEMNRDPRERVITIAHYALVKLTEVQAATDAELAEWVALDNIPSLAFDHDAILRKAFGCLKEKIHFEPVGFELMPEVFTLPQLQNLYESILEIKFDRRNFMKKILQVGVIREAESVDPAHLRSRQVGRTPKYYTFNKEVYEQLKANGKFKLEF